MSEHDRKRWDARHGESGAPPNRISPPPVFADHESLFPTVGTALELACGRGRAGVWLANRGLEFLGVDVSPVAINLARRLAGELSLHDRCRFAVHDLDNGLPDGPHVDLVFCYRFRDPQLDQPIVERLAPGGILAIAVLSEVGAGPGPFRARKGELAEAFALLETVAAGEEDGMAWFMGQKKS